MKWKLLILPMVLLTCGSLLPTDGGQTGYGSLIIGRNPFYLSQWHIVHEITLNITHPFEGVEYYNNNQEINVTVGPHSAESYECYWRVNTGSWNYCGDCTNPLCGSARTFPNGENTLTVLAVDEDGYYVTDSVTFEIHWRLGGGQDLDPILFIPVALALTLVVLDEKRVDDNT